MRFLRGSRVSRPFTLITAAAVACGGVLLSAPTAQAETRSGDVTVTIPSKIVIDGGDIPVTVSSESLYSSLDKVDVDLYQGTALQETNEISPNTAASISEGLLTAGAIVGRADLATTPCDFSSSDPCHFDSNGNSYEFVDGLTYHDSSLATAKYGSKVSLTGVRAGKVVTWTTTVQRYNGFEWIPWKLASVVVGGNHAATTDKKGVATWVESTSARHIYSATVAESATVWGSTSSATWPSEAEHVRASASASKVARGLARAIPSVRKVLTVTKENDPNKLLGKERGYVSAAVMYDSRTSCSDGPGADCGATVEKFSSAAKAKARKHYIQTLLHAAPLLGSERDYVHGHFVLRVAGDLSSSAAKGYEKAFTALFRRR